MTDPKHRFPQAAPLGCPKTKGMGVEHRTKVGILDPPGTEPKGERRRLSRVVHDHKGTATVQWYDAPADYERPVLEIEGATAPAASPKRGLGTGSLAIEREDSHNPYTRVPEADRQRTSGTRTDLRKLSAWIKLMRSLEEAKKRRDEDE